MKRICSVILSSLVFIFMLSMSVTAEAEIDVLAAYQAVLNQFNEQYGMSARFPSEAELSSVGLTIQDRNNFITAMTTDEYFEYLVDNCPDIDNDTELECESENALNEQIVSELGMTRSVRQKYVYNNDNNRYLYADVERHYVGGTCYYSSFSGAGSVYGNNYPFYDYVSNSHSFESNYTKLFVNFTCNYCPSSGVTYSGVIVQCRFRATDNTIYDPQLYI